MPPTPRLLIDPSVGVDKRTGPLSTPGGRSVLQIDTEVLPSTGRSSSAASSAGRPPLPRSRRMTDLSSGGAGPGTDLEVLSRQMGDAKRELSILERSQYHSVDEIDNRIGHEKRPACRSIRQVQARIATLKSDIEKNKQNCLLETPRREEKGSQKKSEDTADRAKREDAEQRIHLFSQELSKSLAQIIDPQRRKEICQKKLQRLNEIETNREVLKEMRKRLKSAIMDQIEAIAIAERDEEMMEEAEEVRNNKRKAAQDTGLEKEMERMTVNPEEGGSSHRRIRRCARILDFKK